MHPTAPMALHRRHLESVGFNFASSGNKSYNVPFSLSELHMALSQFYFFFFLWCSSNYFHFKAWKKEHQLTTDYRTISLTSCICKLLEKIMDIMWYLERGNYTCLLFSMVSEKCDLWLMLYWLLNLPFVRHLLISNTMSQSFWFRESLRHSLAS